MTGVAITLDAKGEPTKVELNGKAIFVSALTIEYLPAEPAKITMTAYVQDIGGVMQRYDNGEPVMETHVLYAVSKADYDKICREHDVLEAIIEEGIVK